MTALPVTANRLFIGTLLLFIACLLMIDPAFAQSTASTASSAFTCSGGKASGALYDTTMSCPTTLKIDNIFSFLVCNMEHLASNLMGQMFCGIVAQLLPAVMAMLTLAVLFFGVGFTIGVIPATARDFQMFLLKMALVFVFATKSEYLIGIGYNLLITGMREGTAIALSSMYSKVGGNGTSALPAAFQPNVANGYAVYYYLDHFLGTAMHFATDYIGMDGTTNACKNAVFAVMALMAVAFPPVFYIGVMIIFRVALTFLRAVFGYIYAIVGIVFLLTCAPFFLTFALFNVTRNFFDRWLGYLVSFSLQVVILFAFLGFVLSINVSNVSKGVTNIIMFDQKTYETTTMRLPWHYCTICDFEVVGPDGNVYDDSSGQGYGVNMISSGALRCKTPKTALNMATAVAPPSNTTTANTALGAAKTQSVQRALLKFATGGLLSLLVLAYVLEYILSYVPALALLLAGGLNATYSPQLGGPDPMGQKLAVDMPGGKLIDTFEQGFTDGYASEGIGRTSIVSTATGLKTGFRRAILGGGGGDDSLPRSAGVNDPGLVQNFTNFMLGGDSGANSN